MARLIKNPNEMRLKVADSITERRCSKMFFLFFQYAQKSSQTFWDQRANYEFKPFPIECSHLISLATMTKWQMLGT